MNQATMQPIYFPFTHIASAALSAMTAFLGNGLVVYRPSRLGIAPDLAGWAGAGRVTLRIPVCGDEDALAGLLREYREWADSRSPGERIAMAYAPPGLPFCDEDASVRIRALLRGKVSAAAGPSAVSDPATAYLLRARLFLHLAQDYDWQQQEIARDLGQCCEVERHLLAALHGPGEAAAHAGLDAAVPGDSGACATAERIGAWYRLMRLDPCQAAGGAAAPIFLTTSPAVFSRLLEERSAATPLLECDIPAAARGGEAAVGMARRALLARMAAGETAALTMPFPGRKCQEDDGSVHVTIVRFDDQTPDQVFARFNEGTCPPATPSTTAAMRHTLAGLVALPPDDHR